MKKSNLSKLLAVGATSAALLSGALFTSNTVQASSSVVLLKVKHNAYKYDRNGKRIGTGYIEKGSTYYSKGAYKIHGKKYHRLDTKKTIYVKDGNLTTRRLTQQVTLKHNSYEYNKYGKRANKVVLLKGDSYFIYGSKRIHGKKYYQVGADLYIKASNASKPFSTYNNSSNGSTTTNTQNSNASANTNTGSTTNTQPATTNQSQNAGSTNTSVNVSGNTNSGQTTPSKPNTGSNTNSGQTTPSKPNTGNKPNTGSTTPDHHYVNHIILPKGYLEEMKKADWGRTLVPDSIMKDTNKFHSESKADDEMKIDIGKMTPEQDFEINDFALRLINELRLQNGQKPWVYTPKSQHVADRVASLYERDNMGLSTWHDQKALQQVDDEAQIHSLELMAGGEMITPQDGLHTMTDLKHVVFDDICSMLFNSTESRHAQYMLTWNSPISSTTSFGLAVSWVEHDVNGKLEHSEHFIAY
ncbi:SEC10/PgrA surface exclusion domain-containing protein [Lactobacillus agrestimuris]|uniref:SEC10/PgrA surface exclusion domain-containing protein n=1 Tax=Lactobacillus agrestimuris TaxID=2941328 RepID=UPI002044AC78|nr:SEC10/PgrA surface exclusion domain-containing protein [Lactobacillus agrestimuris]